MTPVVGVLYLAALLAGRVNPSKKSSNKSSPKILGSNISHSSILARGFLPLKIIFFTPEALLPSF
jgi:hypothetical protein